MEGRIIKYTRETKKSKILNYLDSQGEKKFIIENFTTKSISKKLGFNEEEVSKLVEELVNEGDLETDQIEYDVVFPKGDYKELKKALKEIEFIPIGMEKFTYLMIGGFIIWLLMAASGAYIEFFQDFIYNPAAFLGGFLALIIASYIFGYAINEIYKKILMKNDILRQQVTILRPIFLTGLIIWIIMIVPFGIFYYFLEESTKIYSVIYLVITFPATILAAIEYQKYVAKKLK